MQQNTSETAYFWELFGQFASDRCGRAEMELSLSRHLLATRTGAALSAANTLGVLPRFEAATSRTISEILDGATVGAIPDGLLLDPANDAGAALLRFLSLHLTVALAEKEVALYGPFYYAVVHEDEGALDWEKDETRLSFAWIWDEMLEAHPWKGVRWHDSGLSLDDLFAAPA